MTFDELVAAAENKRSVVHPVWGRVPAAFVLSMQGVVIARALPSLTVYANYAKPYRTKSAFVSVFEQKGEGLVEVEKKRLNLTTHYSGPKGETALDHGAGSPDFFSKRGLLKWLRGRRAK